jgi:hypothetical protein
MKTKKLKLNKKKVRRLDRRTAVRAGYGLIRPPTVYDFHMR